MLNDATAYQRNLRERVQANWVDLPWLSNAMGGEVARRFLEDDLAASWLVGNDNEGSVVGAEYPPLQEKTEMHS